MRKSASTDKGPWGPRDYLFAGITVSVIGFFLFAAGSSAGTDSGVLGVALGAVLLGVGGLLVSISTIAYGVFAGMDHYHARAAVYDHDGNDEA